MKNQNLIYCKTFERYFNNLKEELKNDMKEHEILSLKSCFEQEYYTEIENFIKQGGKISIEVFNNLDGMKQYHFNKHYNYRNDKIENILMNLKFTNLKN